MMDTDTLSILLVQDDETLAAWSCMLNAWLWPKLLPGKEHPQDYKNGRRRMIRKWCTAAVGKKAVSKHWNQNYTQHRMSNDEFERWWVADEAGKYRILEERDDEN